MNTASEPAVAIMSSDQRTLGWVKSALVTGELRAVTFSSVTEYALRYASGGPACVILDADLPDVSGFDLVSELARGGVPAVLVTREPSIRSCVRAMKAGALDFLTLPRDKELLVEAVWNACANGIPTRSTRERIDELRDRLCELTNRERDVFALVASGLSNKQTARHLTISETTVQIHRGRVMRKMRAHSFAELVRMADVLELPLTGISSTRARATASCAEIDRPRDQASARRSLSCRT